MVKHGEKAQRCVPFLHRLLFTPLLSLLIFYFFLLFVSLLFSHREGKCVQRGQAEEKWNEWEGNLKEEKMKRKR